MQISPQKFNQNEAKTNKPTANRHIPSATICRSGARDFYQYQAYFAYRIHSICKMHVFHVSQCSNFITRRRRGRRQHFLRFAHAPLSSAPVSSPAIHSVLRTKTKQKQSKTKSSKIFWFRAVLKIECVLFKIGAAYKV